MASFNESRESIEKYFEWRTERSRPLIDKLSRIINLRGLKVLEIGCGFGQLTKLLSESGALVTSTEVDRKTFSVAKKMLKAVKNIKLILVSSEKLQFKDNTFDLVILFDVIEHVTNPQKMIQECKRVLKKDGFLYCEFTPYFSPIGHHLYDYSKLPIHILPKSIVKNIVYSGRRRGFSTQDEHWNQFISLNKLRITEFQGFVSDMVTLEEEYIVKYPGLFELNLPILSKFGCFKDFFTFSFVGVYKK